MFGKPYDKKKLEYAIKAAQLTRDIKLFGKGINTTIGERGINVSGG